MLNKFLKIAALGVALLFPSSAIKAATQVYIPSTSTFNPYTINIGSGTIRTLRSFDVRASSFSAADGSVANPSYTFSGEPKSGWYRKGTNLLGLTINGTNFWTFDGAGAIIASSGTDIIYMADGSATLPAYTFNAQQDLGIYRAGANLLGFSVGGILRWSLNTSAEWIGNHSGAKIFNGDGTLASPGYNWNADQNTGIYRPDADTMGMSAGGVLVGLFSSTGTSLMATTTNNNAVIGTWGEQFSTASATAQNVATTGQFSNFLSTTVGPGDYDFSGVLIFSVNGANESDMALAISRNSANNTSDHTRGDNWVYDVVTSSYAAADQKTLTVPSWRVSASGTTTVYLKGSATYTVGTPQMRAGRLSFRRAR